MIALTVNATSTAVVFSKSILSRYIAAHSTTDYDKEPVLADELSDLIFTPRFDAKAGVGIPCRFP